MKLSQVKWNIAEKKNNIYSSSLKSKIQSIVLWLLLSCWIYEWTKEFIKYHHISEFQEEEDSSYSTLEWQLKDFYQNKEQHIWKTDRILIDTIIEHTINWQFDELKKDIKTILTTSEWNIREIIFADMFWNIRFNISADKEESIICSDNQTIFDHSFFKNILETLPINKSRLLSSKINYSECELYKEKPSVLSIRKIQLQDKLFWFLIVKYDFPIFDDFFSKNHFLKSQSNISIKNNSGENLYDSKQLHSSIWNIYSTSNTIKSPKEEYILTYSTDRKKVNHEIEANISWSILWLLFFLWYFWFQLYNDKNKKDLLEMLKVKAFEIWNIKIKLKTYTKLLENILESSPFPIVLQNKEWRYILANSSFIRLLGLSSLDSLNSKIITVDDLWQNKDEVKLHKAIDTLLLSNWQSISYEIEREAEDGSSIYYRVRKWLFISDDCEVWWIISLFIDVTDLISATFKAENESKAKSDFLANMSHELRTPLNAIIWFSDILRNELFWDLWPRYKWYAQDIHWAWEHLLQLIEDILDLSKIEHWSIVLDKSNVHLHKIVEQSVSFVKSKCDNKNIKIVINVPENITFQADRLRIKQVIINLLTNSMKFTPNWGCIKINAFAEDDMIVRIEIEDNWIWMEKHQLSKVLEPFYQIDTSAHKAHKGHGLGLWIVNKIIQTHWWTFELESEKGKWTKAIIILPIEFTTTSFV